MNSYQVNSIIFLIFLFIVLLSSLSTSYRETTRLFGRVVARGDLLRLRAIALGIWLYFSMGFAVFSFFMGFYIAASTLFLIPVLGMVSCASTWRNRKRRAGVVLLDLGRYLEDTSVGILVSGLFIVNAVILFVSAFSNISGGSEKVIQSLIYAAMFGGHGSFWMFLSFSHLEIRERGICYPFTIIKWEVMEAYRWIGYEGNTLCLRHQAKWLFSPVLKLKISPAHKSRVEQLLLQYLPVNSHLT